MENNKRLPIKEKTIKKLFAYSGNQCAFIKCTSELVDSGGTMIGKIAHIRSPVDGGPRYDPAWSSEDCRASDNLIILCGKHHDIIDDIDREQEFPAPLIEEYKAAHEARFKSAEKALISRYTDITEAAQPTYPKTLGGLAKVLDKPGMVGDEDEIEGIRLFADQISSLPHDARGFAYQLSARMRRLNKTELLVGDVERAFGIDRQELKEMMDLLEEHQIGEARMNFDDRWVVAISNRSPYSFGLPTYHNPFEEIIAFCEATRRDALCFLEELDFALYDILPEGEA